MPNPTRVSLFKVGDVHINLRVGPATSDNHRVGMDHTRESNHVI